MKKDSFYFSHDYNSRNDPKIMALRSEHGIEGYGIYWALIEIMAEDSKTRLSSKEIKGVAYSLGITEEKLICVLDLCCTCGLFNKDDNKEDETSFYWSSRLLRNKEKREEISRIRSDAGRRGGEANAKQMLSKTKQNEAKERKGKERKGNLYESAKFPKIKLTVEQEKLKDRLLKPIGVYDFIEDLSDQVLYLRKIEKLINKKDPKMVNDKWEQFSKYRKVEEFRYIESVYNHLRVLFPKK